MTEPEGVPPEPNSEIADDAESMPVNEDFAEDLDDWAYVTCANAALIGLLANPGTHPNDSAVPQRAVDLGFQLTELIGERLARERARHHRKTF